MVSGMRWLEVLCKTIILSCHSLQLFEEDDFYAHVCTHLLDNKQERGGLIQIITYGNPNGVSGIHSMVINNKPSYSIIVGLLNPPKYLQYLS